MPSGCDEQRYDPIDKKLLRGTFAYCGRIQPMGFRQAPASAVVFGQSSAAHLDRQAECLQALVESPAGTIDDGGILEWGFGLYQNALEHLRLLCQEDGNVLRSLGDIARLAGQGQIADPIGASPGSWHNMLDLQRHRLLPTVRTAASPLLEQVL